MHNGNTEPPDSVVYSNTMVVDTDHDHLSLLVGHFDRSVASLSIMDIDRAYRTTPRPYETDVSYEKRMHLSRGAGRALLHVPVSCRC